MSFFCSSLWSAEIAHVADVVHYCHVYSFRWSKVFVCMNAEPEDEAASICSDLLLKAQAAAARRRSVKLCHTSEEAIGATRWFTGIHICNYSHGAACLDDSAVKAISLLAFIEHTELFPSWLLKIKRRTTLPSSRTLTHCCFDCWLMSHIFC